MRTTVELPDEILTRAKSRAALAGISLRQFFIEAVEQKLAPENRKVRRDPPAVGSKKSRPIRDLTSKQIDGALFG
jgi:hypothetical protein